MKYRIRCGELYYCGIVWDEGKAFQKWAKDDWSHCPLEMTLNDAVCTLTTLLETGKFTEMPTIVEVKNE